MLSKYNYYTGIIFHAYSYGYGEPIAKGGRYDNLLSHFGRELPRLALPSWWISCSGLFEMTRRRR